MCEEKKIMITSAVFIRYETDKNFDKFWQWLIWGANIVGYTIRNFVLCNMWFPNVYPTLYLPKPTILNMIILAHSNALVIFFIQKDSEKRSVVRKYSGCQLDKTASHCIKTLVSKCKVMLWRWVLWQYITEYTVANLWCYLISHHITFDSGLMILIHGVISLICYVW